MNIYSITDTAQSEWHWLKTYIERSIARNVDGYTAEDVLEAVLDGQSLFMVIEDDTGPLMVATINILPEALHVHTMTGDKMSVWLHPFQTALMQLGEVLGKSYITSISRKGMAKIMSAGGWEIKSMVMQRKVI